MTEAEDGSSVDVVQLYIDALAVFGTGVQDVADHEWDLPTPCTDWNVRELVAHVVLGEAHLPLVLEGGTASTDSDFSVDLLGPTPITTWRGTALKAIEAARMPGIAEREYHLDLGDVTGQQLLSYRITDNVVHAWDLRVGIGRPAPIVDEHAEFLLEFWLPVALDMGQSNFFATPTEPQSDSLSDRLLALLGRTPPPL